jgi:serine/threonine protein kinase/tetratricopeptide (TPR) repeat protein
MMDSMENGPKASLSKQPAMPREEVIFDAALALLTAQRPAYLDQACGHDGPLRQRVELLLQSHEQAGEFLEPSRPASGPGGTMVVAPPPSEKPGDVIGNYKIRELLGEGGCGAVYVAEQTEPVRRRVALKVIKLGMDTRSVIARFEAERQALAMMDHPNIARVLDAGTTSSGRPYFVMELVRGIRITDYCDQNHLNTGQRLDLFIQVCHAVQHAHQKGIIHRDLKPSNILVTLHDGVPVPKVIDFGIAKATEGRLTDLTVYTELHQFIGTPAYMSPEQAEMSGLDIDTRSDIYSLGVLLYELLTGKTPFDAKELARAGLEQMRRTIREQEPMRPSTQLSTMLDADLTAVAKRHGAEAPKLVHLVRGDLDWIVMKALEKDRARRFDTANALAADVGRFLSNEPVEARPPSSVYRFQKLVRRNKTVFAAGGTVVAALVLGLGLSLNLFLKEKAAVKRAVAAERRQAELREQAERGLAIERQMRAMAQMSDKFTTAGRFMSLGQFEKAEEVMSQVPLGIPQSSIIYNTIGLVRARRGEWQAAITNYSKSVATDPTNHLGYDCLAPLLAWTGDRDAYRDFRGRALQHFGQTSDPGTAGHIGLDCLILPASGAELEILSGMTDRALTAGSNTPGGESFEVVKGLADYRQGQCASAIIRLQKVLADGTEPARMLQAFMTLAMAQKQLQQTDAAAATLARGLKYAEDKVPGLDAPDWEERMTAHLLMREAKALFQQTPNAAKEPK